MNQIILIKYGEFFLKGLNKKSFEQYLINDIKYKINNICKYKLIVQESIIMISVDPYIIDKIFDLISQTIFGIAYVCKAFICEKNISMLEKAALNSFEKINLNDFKSFKIFTKRADKNFEFTSFEVSSRIGELIKNKYNKKVDLKNHDILFNIEIRRDNIFFFFEKQKAKGLGGLPLNSSGNALSLISGGLDSPVASYMMLKRGLKLKYLHFYSYPYTSENSKEKVKKICKALSAFSNESNLYIVNFTKIQETIKKYCSNKLMTILIRRSMLRIAEKFSKKIITNAIITGDSLGQVASQTLNYINIVEENIKIPILRPLIGMDKTEIIKISKQIKTYQTSILPYEDCCTIFTPKHPKLSINSCEVNLEEEKINLLEYEENAINKIILEI